MKAALGLGSNQGDSRAYLRAALQALDGLHDTTVTAVSSLYRTAPVGYTDQPDFFNAVAEIETALSPHALLGACLGIEAALGRVRTFRNAPRVIDIDLLFMDTICSSAPEMILPPPRVMERGFVLIPLLELHPDGWGYQLDLAGAVRRVGSAGVVRVESDFWWKKEEERENLPDETV